MTYLRENDIQDSFNYFDNDCKCKLNKEEIVCAVISLFGAPPSKVKTTSQSNILKNKCFYQEHYLVSIPCYHEQW